MIMMMIILSKDAIAVVMIMMMINMIICMLISGIKWFHDTRGRYLTKIVHRATIVGMAIVMIMMMIKR